MRNIVVYDYQIFMEENGQRVLIASYFSDASPPVKGCVIEIEQFKEGDQYPDHVTVVDVVYASDEVTSIIEDALVIYLFVEPA